MNAFQLFGGYAQEILYDNMKQIVLKRGLRSSESDWNPKFEDFFTHYGFVPRLCRPYRPQTKGKIENTVGFVKRDFFMGGKFRSFSDLNSQLQGWLSRVNSTVHGTTYEIPRDRFKEESLHLRHIDQAPSYHNVREETRKISRDAYVSYLGNRYSVPYRFAGMTSILRISDTSFAVVVGSEEVCTHEILPGRGRVSRNKDHFKGLLSEILNQNSTHQVKGSNVLKFNDPDVEHRSLAVYDAFVEGDKR
jgi:hypothetical protein